MEHLKQLADIYQPDERNQNRVDIDLTTGAVTPTTIESIYAVVEEIKLNAGVPDEVRSHFEGKVYETTIPRNVRLSEAPSFGKPILLYDVASKGARSYLDLAREFLDRQADAPAVAAGAR